MTKTCGECPWLKFASVILDGDGALFDGVPVGECRFGVNAGRLVTDPVCTARRAFEVLRNEVRRLRRENERLVSEGGKP